MGKIILRKILKNANRIEFDFFYSDDLKSYFTFDSFYAEYDNSILQVPDAVCAVPFVCNVLPIIWLTDSELEIPELDEDFYNSIPEFKKGYIDMFPDAVFKGNINVKKVIKCQQTKEDKAILFFSGGLDAVTSLLRHKEENLELLAVWGADISCDNEIGWNVLKETLFDSSKNYGFPLTVVRSSFRKFDNEGKLCEDFSSILHDDWWHGVKHGIGLIGHASVWAWQLQATKVYIASSFSVNDKNITCASWPTIDNNVRFCGVQVIHDGFEMSRMDKIQYVSDYQKIIQQSVPLHVCWEASNGYNCCRCEKCLRTLVAIRVANGNPSAFGLMENPNTYKYLYHFIALHYNFSPSKKVQWSKIQNAFLKNQQILDKSIKRQLKWLKSFDFLHPECNFCRKVQKVKDKIRSYRSRLALRFPALYVVYKKIKNHK